MILALARRAAGALALAALSGCALLPFGDEKKPTEPPPEPTRPLYRLEVEAPDDLRELLQEHLDLARFRVAPVGETIDDSELRRLAAAAPAQARALLETEGFFGAEVTVAREDPPDTLPLLRVRVQPGPRTRVETAQLTFTGALQDAAQAQPQGPAARLAASLKREWPLGPGKPFRQYAWGAAKNATLTQLRAEGYPTATWEHTQARVDAARHSAALELEAASGPLFLLGPLHIEGVERYDEESVRHLAGFAAGEPYREKTLLDFQERLAKSGLFEAAVVTIDPDPARAAQAPVQVQVREQPLQQATVGVGISANTGPRVTFEHLHRKPFGWRWSAKNQFEFGSDLKNWQGELLSHPLEGQYRNLVAGQAERLRSGDELRTSWSARIGRTQDTARFERLYFGEFVHSRLDTVAGSTRSDAVSGNYHWVLRDVDSVLLPTQGYTLSAQAGIGEARGRKTGTFTGPASDRGPFSRLYGRLTAYQPLGASWYAMARVEAGQVFARDALPIPDTLLFRAGGDDSVRGYAYRTLGPTVDGALASGRVLLTGSAEIARPVSARLPSVWWAAFFDAGNAANSWTALKLARGYGLGLRWRSPVGPLRADLAYGEELRRVRLHVSVGIAF
ncbi:MAG: BamA/TamA family outer membrane protein [Piscinibacter sp.]|nr:BamA/TamA family outer membrane protein [Piscinibacter sp.]